MTEVLNKLLAGLFEKFKQSSPLLATLMLIFLGSVNYVVTSASTLGLELPQWLLKAVEWISFILIALTGSKTFNFIHPPKEGDQTQING